MPRRAIDDEVQPASVIWRNTATPGAVVCASHCCRTTRPSAATASRATRTHARSRVGVRLASSPLRAQAARWSPNWSTRTDQGSAAWRALSAASGRCQGRRYHILRLQIRQAAIVNSHDPQPSQHRQMIQGIAHVNHSNEVVLLFRFNANLRFLLRRSMKKLNDYGHQPMKPKSLLAP